MGSLEKCFAAFCRTPNIDHMYLHVVYSHLPYDVCNVDFRINFSAVESKCKLRS